MSPGCANKDRCMHCGGRQLSSVSPEGFCLGVEGPQFPKRETWIRAPFHHLQKEAVTIVSTS